MIRARVLIAAVLAIALTAATAPPIDDPEARIAGQLVSEIVVRSGPAWWEVSKGSRRVHVLGVMWSYPPDRRWNQRSLERRIRTAKTVLLPAALQAGSSAVVDDSLPPSDWDSYPASVRQRVAAAATRLNKPPGRYLGRPPVVAGYLMVSDFREGLGLKNEALTSQITKTVRAAGVAARNVAVIPVDRYTKALSGVTHEASQGCLEAALSEVESGEPAMRQAIDGWAAGEVATALEAPRGLELCGFALPGQAELRRAVIDAEVNAIAAVLDGEPGSRPTAQYVAVINLRTLVAEGGVLDKLRQRGYQVRSPQD